MKKTYLVLVIVGIIVTSSFVNISTQSSLEKQIVFEYENAQMLQFIQIQSLEVEPYSNIVDIEKTGDGTIFVLLIDTYYPMEYKLFQYSQNDGFTFLRNFSLIIGGILSRENTLTLFGQINSEDPLQIIEMDYFGNITRQFELSLGNQYLYPWTITLADDTSYNLIAYDYYHDFEYHLMKIDNNGLFVWDKNLNQSASCLIDIQTVITSGQILMLNYTHLTSYANDGSFLWIKSLGNPNFWSSRTMKIKHNDAVKIIAYRMEDYDYVGTNILRFDLDGNLQWNASITGKHPVGSEADTDVYSFSVQNNYIFGLAEIGGAYHNPFMFEISHEGELLNFWGLNFFNLGTEFLEFRNDGSPLIITINRTSPETKHLVVLTFPSVIPQSASPSIGRTIGLVLILIGSVTVIGVVVVFWRSKKK